MTIRLALFEFENGRSEKGEREWRVGGRAV